MKIGKPVFEAFANNEADHLPLDFQLASHHIEQGPAEAGLKNAEMADPLALLRTAYAI